MGKVKDGPACPGCGLPNYEGLCPRCRGDQVEYEEKLVPPFETSVPSQNKMVKKLKEKSMEARW